jgi:hypothetical protein
MRKILITSLMLPLLAYPQIGVAAPEDRSFRAPAVSGLQVARDADCEESAAALPSATFVPRVRPPNGDFKLLVLDHRSGRLQLRFAGAAIGQTEKGSYPFFASVK